MSAWSRKKKPKKKFVRCGAAYKHKIGDTVFTRYCSLEKGHWGKHR